MFKPWVFLQFFVKVDYFQQIATKLYCCIFTSLLKPSPRPLWSSSRLCHSLISSKWGNKELNPCLQVYASHLYCEKEKWWFWYFVRMQRNVMQIEICFGYISIQIVFNPARIRLVLQHLVLTGTTFSNHCKPHFRWLWRQNIKLSRIW